MQNLNNVPRASYNCNRHTSMKDTQIIFHNIMRMYGQTKQHGQLFSEPLSKDRPILIPNIPYQRCWGLLAQYPYTGKMYWEGFNTTITVSISISILQKNISIILGIVLIWKNCIGPSLPVSGPKAWMSCLQKYSSKLFKDTKAITW